jgi:ATP-dependent DNA helicase DinG
VGLPYDEERPFLTVSVSFDFKRRLLLLTPMDPSSPPKQDQEHMSAISRNDLPMLRSSEGGALCCSPATHAEAVKERSVTDGENHLRCTARGADVHLLSQFIQENDSSCCHQQLWEGVDAPGQTLRMVIIVKLPFQVPSDPVFKARCDALDAQGGSGFGQLGIPSATMRLKQGFGRLLRTKDDRGIVLILDGRLMTKGYGVTMLRALPPCFHP